MENPDVLKLFGDMGLTLSYERFVQLQPGATIVLPAADATFVQVSSQVSASITLAEGEDLVQTAINRLLVFDSPVSRITLTSASESTTVVRATGFITTS